MVRRPTVEDTKQGTLTDSAATNDVKTRLYAMRSYDWRRLPHRVSSTIQADLSRMAWYDEGGREGSRFYYSSGIGEEVSSRSSTEFIEFENKLPNPIYRDSISFYPIAKEVKQGSLHLSPLQLDPGYIEFFIDILVGSIGLYRRRDALEIWRRFGRIVHRIESLETFYGVSKPVAGVYEIMVDMLTSIPLLAPLRVTSGVAINETLYGGLGEEPLTDDIVPKHIIDADYTDVRKAQAFFDLICPEQESQHNLMMATVYPYYKRNNEKFFILKGSGGNGKSTYMEHFDKLIGGKFGTVDLAGLAATGFERTNAIGRMQGKLVLQANETDMTEPKFVAELKKIATGDYFIGRSIGNNSFEFKCEAVLFMDTNTIVNVDSSPAMQRRVVGVSFVDRRLTWDDLEPYKDWINTAEGACSIFLCAYYYLQEECAGQFSWNDIDVNEDEEFSDEATRGIHSLMFRASEEGIGKASVLPDAFGASNRWERKRLYDHFGLTSGARRIKGQVTRVVFVENHDLFAQRMRREGFSVDEQKDKKPRAASKRVSS